MKTEHIVLTLERYIIDDDGFKIMNDEPISTKNVYCIIDTKDIENSKSLQTKINESIYNFGHYVNERYF